MKLREPRPESISHYQRVEDLEKQGWEIVSTASVQPGKERDLLAHAEAVTPSILYEGPVIAVASDGNYVCMRKKKADFAAERARAND